MKLVRKIAFGSALPFLLLAVGCGPASGTLTEGVYGPLPDNFVDDLRQPEVNNVVRTLSGVAQFYVQAIVNDARIGGVVTARLTGPAQAAQTFNATMDGDVGILFRFLRNGGSWPAGSYTVAVDDAGRAIGSVQFTISN